jgi:hypothetical protein
LSDTTDVYGQLIIWKAYSPSSLSTSFAHKISWYILQFIQFLLIYNKTGNSYQTKSIQTIKQVYTKDLQENTGLEVYLSPQKGVGFEEEKFKGKKLNSSLNINSAIRLMGTLCTIKLIKITDWFI